MQAEASEVLAKTMEMIEVTRHEIIQLHAEIQVARATVERSLKLLARAEPDVPSLPRKLGPAL